MLKLEVAQHVFGNVEAEESAGGAGGFQTLFYTRSLLTEPEAREIEDKAVYFHSETNPVKRLFFSLSTGKVVMGYIVPLMEEDRFGREGGYLAHSFVLPPEDFSRVGEDPFTVFRASSAVVFKNTAEALKAGDTRTGDIGPAKLSVDPGHVDSPGSETLAEMEKWQPVELSKLAHYTLILLPVGEQKPGPGPRGPIAFCGDSAGIDKALQAAFVCVPRKYRTRLAFDTHFHGCNPVRTPFWAVGYPGAAPAQIRLARVDAKARTVSEPLPPENGLYEQWVRTCIQGRRFTDLWNQGQGVLELQGLLRGKTFDKEYLREALKRFPDSFFESVTRVYHVPMREKLTGLLEKAVGPKIAHRLAHRAAVEPGTGHGECFALLLDGFDNLTLARELYASLLKKVEDKPGRKEREEIKAFFMKTKYMPMALLFSLWEKDYAGFARGLGPVAEDYGDEASALLRALTGSQLEEVRAAAGKKNVPLPPVFMDAFRVSAAAGGGAKKSHGFFGAIVNKLLGKNKK